MAIRRLVYLACDRCLEICDHSDADDAKGARQHGRDAGWKRIDGEDVCPKCQGL